MIIVEGQMDVIAMHKMGFTHTVAVMGIALSDLCIKKLKSLTNNFILGLDSDEAGVRAMERINAQLLKNGIVAKYLNYGPYKDPDEFLENNDKQLLEQRIQQSPRFLETLMEQKMRPLLQNNGNLEQKLQCMHEIFHLIAPLEESLLASELVVQSAQSLGLQSAPAQIMTNYRSFLQEQKHRTADIRPTSANSPMVNITTEGESSFSRQHHPSQTPAPRPQHVHPPWVLGKGPRKLLQTSIIHPECLIVKEFTEIIPFIEHPPLLEVLSWLKELYYEIDEPEYSKVILDYMAKKNIPSELSDLMGSALFHYRGHNTLKEKTAVRLLKDFRAQILRDQLLSQRQQLQEKQKKCNDGQENLTIMSAINQIDKKVLEIKLNLAK